jgi:hypothetical protein
MSKRIVLISCVSQKLTSREKEKELYISTLFKLNLKYANSLKFDDIYILSAKYGLLNLEQEIEPYEQTLNNMPAAEVKIWANKVLTQLQGITSLDDTEVTFLAGERYRKYLLPYVKKPVIPLKGLRIGEQLKRLKELTV